MSKRSFFTDLETPLLKELVNKNISVVENKRTDFKFIKEKSSVWIKIAEEFSCNSNVNKRNDKQLKKCWENMKNSAKKRVAEERRERLRTGGGQVSPVNDDAAEISGMVSSQIHPLKNMYDDDAGADDIELQESSTREFIDVAGVNNDAGATCGSKGNTDDTSPPGTSGCSKHRGKSQTSSVAERRQFE